MGTDWFVSRKKCQSNCREGGAQQEHSLSKAKLRLIEHGHDMDGWPLCATLCACPEISLESNSGQTIKVFPMRLRTELPHVSTYAKRSHTHIKDPI